MSDQRLSRETQAHDDQINSANVDHEECTASALAQSCGNSRPKRFPFLCINLLMGQLRCYRNHLPYTRISRFQRVYVCACYLSIRLGESVFEHLELMQRRQLLVVRG